jgi:hypothetical protein
MFGRNTLLIPKEPLMIGQVQFEGVLPQLALELSSAPHAHAPVSCHRPGFGFPFPCRPEVSTWAGMILTHYGRVTMSGEEDQLGINTVQIARLSTSVKSSIQQLRGYYSTGPSRTSSPLAYSSGQASAPSHPPTLTCMHACAQMPHPQPPATMCTSCLPPPAHTHTPAAQTGCCCV